MSTTDFDPGRGNIIVNNAYQIAVTLGSEYVTLEHLLLSLIKEDDFKEFCNKYGIKQSLLESKIIDYIANNMPVAPSHITPKLTKKFEDTMNLSIVDTIHRNYSVLSSLIIAESILKDENAWASFYMKEVGITELLLEEDRMNSAKEDEETENTLSESEEFLRKYCVCLNDTVHQNRLNPLIGRHKEVDEVELILARKNKANAILVGEAGVGKSAVVEGIAKQIVDGNARDSLKNAQIWSLDMGTLLSGTKYRGEMEERLTKIIESLTEMNTDEKTMVLFIDEIHTIMNAGGSNSSPLDVGNMLKPALARGAFKVIGATTLDEYRKHFEKDKALIRRFQKVQIDEPSVVDSIEILNGLKPIYEKFHNVKFDKTSIEEAVTLSHRYITNRFLPDKAIDIIDIAGAKEKLKQKTGDTATKITKEMIEEVVSKMAKIPAKTVKESETDKLKTLQTDLEKSVIGQEQAIVELSDSVIMNRMGLREKGKPQGSYLLVGPSGTGKTFLVNQLAKTLDLNVIRFDMSEYMEKHSVAKMIGAPPGYAGYSDGQSGSGILVNKIEENPYSIVFLDEIEKAHPDVFNIFLQVMEDGRLTSSDGKTVNFENSIIIMTSNAGARDMAKTTVGFGNSPRVGLDDIAIEKAFSPEFRNRLDAIIKFNPLSKEDMLKIVDIEVKKFIAQLKEQKVKLKITASAKKYLAEKGHDPKMGARPLKRLIQNEIKKPLSKIILFEDKKEFSVNVVDNALVIN